MKSPMKKSNEKVANSGLLPLSIWMIYQLKKDGVS